MENWFIACTKRDGKLHVYLTNDIDVLPPGIVIKPRLARFLKASWKPHEALYYYVREENIDLDSEFTMNTSTGLVENITVDEYIQKGYENQ